MLCANGKSVTENIGEANEAVKRFSGMRLNRRRYIAASNALERAGHGDATICVYRIDTDYFVFDGDAFVGTGTTSDPDGRMAEIDVTRRRHRADYDPCGGSGYDPKSLFVLVTRDDLTLDFNDPND